MNVAFIGIIGVSFYLGNNVLGGSLLLLYLAVLASVLR